MSVTVQEGIKGIAPDADYTAVILEGHYLTAFFYDPVQLHKLTDGEVLMWCRPRRER
ncbi:hypothetical protein ACFQ5Q_08970 [Luteolibacter ambystomatis]